MIVGEVDSASLDVIDDDQTVDDTAVEAAEMKSADRQVDSGNTRGRITVSVRTLLVGLVMAIVGGGIGVLAWFAIAAHSAITAHERQVDNYKHAEEIALDYAVGAAKMDIEDLNTWTASLVKGTSPELGERLTNAATSMEQILAPLQWRSSARPLVAKVRSESGGSYIVDSFVSVLTKTTEAPEGLYSTATYSVTIDSDNNWQITDVGGIDAIG